MVNAGADGSTAASDGLRSVSPALAKDDEGGSGKGKQPRKRGRKRINEDLTNIKGNDTLDSDVKRKLQNRAAQRAFRERKEKHVSDLEDKVAAQESELAQCRELIEQLRAENEALRRGDSVPSVLSGESPFAQRTLPSSDRTGSPPDVKPSLDSPAPVSSSPSFANILAGPSPQAACGAAPPPPNVLPPPAPAAFPSPPEQQLQPSTSAPPFAIEQQSSAPVLDIDMTGLDDLSFDFDAPFDFSDSISLPPIFSSLMDDLVLPPSVPPSTVPSAVVYSDDVCPGEDDEPPPLPNGRIPCDKPECDFTAVSCALPIPWRPPQATGNDKDLWVAQKCWAKLLSHPLFVQCDSVRLFSTCSSALRSLLSLASAPAASFDSTLTSFRPSGIPLAQRPQDDLCQELRDKTRCSDDGRLVCHKNDVCDIFRSIPARVKLRQQQLSMR
ncbi:SPOSA6832_04384, partial [Sporobolomyces salmonicolor]